MEFIPRKYQKSIFILKNINVIYFILKSQKVMYTGFTKTRKMGELIMKKGLLASFILGSALVLGACSNDANEATNTKEEVKSEEVKVENNEFTYEIDSEEKVVELEANESGDEAIKNIYLPNEFESVVVNGDFSSKGTGDFDGLGLVIEKARATEDNKRREYQIEKIAGRTVTNARTELQEFDLEAHPNLAKKYEFVKKATHGNGFSYHAMKVMDEESIIISIGSPHKSEPYFEKFALKTLENIEFK